MDTKTQPDIVIHVTVLAYLGKYRRLYIMDTERREAAGETVVFEYQDYALPHYLNLQVTAWGLRGYKTEWTILD